MPRPRFEGKLADEKLTLLSSFKSDAFQSDIYPPALGDEPGLTADEWFSGKDANPKTIDLESGFQVKAKQEFVTSAQVESPAGTEPSTPTASKSAAASISSDEVRRGRKRG
jgi:hypothetical protein